MSKWLKKEMWVPEPGDASIMGWQWRVLTGFGVGFLLKPMMELNTDYIADKGLWFTLARLSVGIIALLMGEYILLKRQDEFFKQVETRAIALGGMGAIVASFVLALYFMIEPHPMAKLTWVFLGQLISFYAIRTAYATWVHEKHKKLMSEDD